MPCNHPTHTAAFLSPKRHSNSAMNGIVGSKCILSQQFLGKQREMVCNSQPCKVSLVFSLLGHRHQHKRNSERQILPLKHMWASPVGSCMAAPGPAAVAWLTIPGKMQKLEWIPAYPLPVSYSKRQVSESSWGEGLCRKVLLFFTH